MEAMTKECCAFFHGPDYNADDFHAMLLELCLQSESQYSYLNSIVAISGNETVGIAVSYDGGNLRRLRRVFIESAWRMFNRDFSQIGDETKAGELYIDSLAVKPSFRCCRIGTRLLEASVNKARMLGVEKVGLLVDDNNPDAERLYKRCGFELVGVSSWGGHGMKHLQLSV